MLKFELKALRDVITSLYNDPANTYIEMSYMVYFAKSKLMGKDIESDLRDQRKHVVESNRLMEESKAQQK